LDLTPKEQELLDALQSLYKKVRNYTFAKYKRINPFYEDLFSWKERGRFWTQKNNVTIYNSATIVGDVEIGEHSWIGPFSSIDGSGGVKIGHHCSISAGCQLASHDTVKWALSGGIEAYEYKSIIIGNCCFLGSHVIVSKGVIIGDHCLVAAGSVVTKNVESFSIVGGVPAKKIGYIELDENQSVTLHFTSKI
jgi:acetyltransferase-like isoleucine patch superfamily enzyme